MSGRPAGRRACCTGGARPCRDAVRARQLPSGAGGSGASASSTVTVFTVVEDRVGSYVTERMVVTLVDDVDGTEAVETVIYGIDGIAYAIDLNAVNAQELRDALAPYLPSAAVWAPCHGPSTGGTATRRVGRRAGRATGLPFRFWPGQPPGWQRSGVPFAP